MKTQKLQELIHLFHRPGENHLISDLLLLNEENEEQDLKNRSLMVEASYLVNREIQIGDGPYVRVITVKMFKEEGVVLELGQKVGERLIYYGEIPYQKDLIKIKDQDL